MPYADPAKRRAAVEKWQKSHPENRRASAQKWRLLNAEKVRTSKREYRSANRELIAEYNSKYLAMNRERLRAKMRAKYQEALEVNRAKSRARRLLNLEDARNRAALWKKLNPSRHAANEAARRVRTANPAWADRSAINEIYGSCPEGMVVDHIVPLKGRSVEDYPVCGLHVSWNLQYLSRSENGQKHNRMRPQDEPCAGVVFPPRGADGKFVMGIVMGSEE